jgi:uncharacterized protein YndB with AHSA1/START domain
MKFFKYLGLLLIILVLCFFAVGLLKPTVDYGHTITVDKPVTEAWAVHQDATKYNQWLKGFQSIELIEGEQNAVGSKYRVAVIPQEGADEFVMIETIKSIKPNDHITLHFDSDFMEFDQTTTFKSKGNQTTITTDSKTKGSTFINRCLFGSMELLGGMFKAGEVENIENLKTVINNNTDVYDTSPKQPAMMLKKCYIGYSNCINIDSAIYYSLINLVNVFSTPD